MKNFVNGYRSLPLHERVLYVVCAAALVVLGLIVSTEQAHAQSGNVYDLPQAQVVGDTYEAVVLQVSFKEVVASHQARAAGAALGGAAGLVLASRSGSRSPWAVNSAAALVGGLLGERAAYAVATTHAQEIVLRIRQSNDMWRTVTIVQPAPFDHVSAGEVVYVTATRGAYRVLRRAL